jgi:hypothetical protein
MSINFSYEIVSVNKQARCMEIVYTAEGYPTQHIGARLPYEGEELKTIIHMYAPIYNWLELNKTVIVPEVGTSGYMPLADEIEQERQRLQELESRVKTSGAQTL